MREEVGAFMKGLLAGAKLDLSCECRIGEEEVSVFLEGEDASLVLRENAKLLYALNHLLSQAFYRKVRGRFSFQVDCEDYRGTRVLELQLLARKAAENVVATGKSFRLQPMPSMERRVIHLALAEVDGVRSESEGRGEYRRVVIEPA